MKKKKKKVKLTPEMKEQFQKELFKMQKARKLLSLPGMDKFLERDISKMPEGDLKELMKNKNLRVFALANMLHSLGINEINIKKTDLD